MNPPPTLSRRRFLGATLATTAAAAGQPAPAPPGRRIKLGLIGCGGRGAWLGGLFRQHGGFEIHATADYFQEQADRAGDELGEEAVVNGVLGKHALKAWAIIASAILGGLGVKIFEALSK